MTDVLYAARGGSATSSDLYTLDPVTAVETSVGPIGFGLTGLAFDPISGNLYGSTSANSSVHPNSLVTVNPATGTGTFVAAFSASPIPDICFDAAGQLYGWDQAAQWFCKINKATGAVTDVGTPTEGPTAGDAISVNGSGVCWAFIIGSGEAFTINLTTGAATAAFNPANQGTLVNSFRNVQAGTFDAANLFWAIVFSKELATFNTATGTWAHVGALAGTANWDALAWGPAAGGGTPPVFVSAAVNGDTATVVMDQLLKVSPGPSPSEFKVTADSFVVPVVSASVSGSDCILGLAHPVDADAHTTITYTAP